MMVNECPLSTELLCLKPGVGSLKIEQLKSIVIAVYIESLIVIDEPMQVDFQTLQCLFRIDDS